MNNENLNRTDSKTLELKKEVRKQTFGYILTALGLVAGLAWNDAIKGMIDYLLPLARNTMVAKFFYAFVITIVVVFISSYLLKSSKELDK